MTIQTKIEEFKVLPYETKLKISMNIITNFKDAGNQQAQKIYDYISKLSTIPEIILEDIYDDFETSIERIKQEKVESEMHGFSKAQNYIQHLQELEAKERAEEHVEDILDQI